MAEVLTMPKNTILSLIYFIRAGARQPAIFGSKSARVARTPCMRSRPGKLNRGLSQCERKCGHHGACRAIFGVHFTGRTWDLVCSMQNFLLYLMV